MKPMLMIVVLAGGFALQAQAMECGSTVNRAGCVGPNGATEYNRNTGQVNGYNRNTGETYKRQPYTTNRVAPGTQYHGAAGENATKAVEPGCTFVNGQRVCR